jgi:hypothetical protein
MKFKSVWKNVLSYVGFKEKKYDVGHFDLEFGKNRASIDDGLRVKLYGNFLKNNRELFDKDSVRFWRECGRVYEREIHNSKYFDDESEIRKV